MSPRLILELAMALIIIVGGLVYHKHVEDLGEAKIVALDQKLAAAVTQHNEDAEKLAQSELNHIGVVYEKAVAIPAVPDIGLVCQPSGRGQAPAAADYRPAAPGSAALPGAGLWDPTGPLLTLLRHDDDQIDGLIDTVGVLETYIKNEQ